MTGVKVGVCEAPPELHPGSSGWQSLCESVARVAPHLFLLNELPFGPWLSSQEAFDAPAWTASCKAHADGARALRELGAAVVATSRACKIAGRRCNEALVWTRQDGPRGVHTKQYFPDEPGYFEARWFAAGERHFRVVQAGALRVGFLICTEVMFNEHARRYGREGAHAILVPRAVGSGSLGRWLVAMRMAAIVSGGYVLSSNRAGTDPRGQTFGGAGWIIDPRGDVVAQTSADNPLAFCDLDLELVARAQAEYPCYVRE